MKCPKCGEELPGYSDRESRKSLYLVAVVIIVVLLVATFASTSIMMSALKPRPSLTGELTVTYAGWYSVPNEPWSAFLSGFVHNYGDTGCFATLNYDIEGAQEWSANGSIHLGWIPGEGGIALVSELFEGEPMDGYSHPPANTLKLSYNFNYTEP